MEQIKKILIIGSYGMAGHVIYTYLKENSNYVIVDIARSNYLHRPTHQLDITDFEDLSHVLEKENPYVVINCIGVLNKDAEENPNKAILLNSYLPHFLASKGEKLKFKLIHISTDCVFSGKTGNYAVDSLKDGIGFYAQSKALGEVAYGNNLTLRTSIIGPELKKKGIGLFNWFINQKGLVKGYKNAYWTGVTTIELAKVINFAIENDMIGLHHLVNGEKINKYDLINIFKDIFNKDEVQIQPFDDYKVDKSLVLSKDLGYKVSSYEVMIKEMKEWINSHNNIYSNITL